MQGLPKHVYQNCELEKDIFFCMIYGPESLMKIKVTLIYA